MPRLDLGGMIGGEQLFSMISLLLLGLVVGLLIWGSRLRRQVKDLQTRIQPYELDRSYAKSARRSADIELSEASKQSAEIIAMAEVELKDAREKAAQMIRNAELHLQGPRETASQIIARAERELTDAREEASQIIQNAQQEYRELQENIESLKSEASTTKSELENLAKQLKLKADDAHLLEVGFYQPVYGFEELSEYRSAIERIKNDQKSMLRRISGRAWFRRENFDPTRDFSAVIVTETVSYNGSDAQGEKLLMKIQKLMLKAFNGECDACTARVNYRNIATMEKRIRSAFEQIDSLGKAWHCELFPGYLDSRLEELRLVHEYAELQERIKREQAAIREQMREEEKALREAERATKKLEDERLEYERQLATEKDKEKISELQRIIEELNAKERAISQAQLTRAGHVYILSNIGSFGENVLKIGMTRREDPGDRVRELGDASVPFPFDVHAMIATKDAPTLEKALHNHFSQRRVNLENERKEFFKISIQEIKEELQRLKDQLGIESEIHLSLIAEAKEYRQSEARRSYMLNPEHNT